MYLYEKKKDKLLIHELTINERDLPKYRRIEMESIPENERDATGSEKALCSYSYKCEHYIEQYKNNKIKNLIVNQMPFNRMELDSFDKDSCYLRNYYNGQYAQNIVIGSDNNYYLFVRDVMYGHRGLLGDWKYGYMTMIHIPETLFVLQLLQQEKLSLIPKTISPNSIISPLSLCNHEVVDELDLSQFKKSDKYFVTDNISDEVYKKVLEKSKADSFILSKIKR